MLLKYARCLQATNELDVGEFIVDSLTGFGGSSSFHDRSHRVNLGILPQETLEMLDDAYEKDQFTPSGSEQVDETKRTTFELLADLKLRRSFAVLHPARSTS